MGVSCDRCNERSKNLSDYENEYIGVDLMVLCHECACEIRDGNEK